jgi:DNA polymerase elongation subunit (family B)
MLEIYNIEDAKLLHELDEKYNIIGIIFSIASITHTTVPSLINPDTATSGVNHSTAVDGLVLYLAYRRQPRLIFPTRIFSEDYEKQTFEGSIVFDMVPGVHRDVATLDFSSLYPSLIKTFNIGTETYKKDGSGDIKAVIGSFEAEPKSILAEAVEYMGKKRNEYKKLRDLAIPNSEEYHIRAGQQFGVKSILLSFYGVIGYQSSRYFNLDIASNVTLLGQAFTKKAKELAEKSGFIVLAGDTDSIFVKSRTEFKRGGIVEESQKLADEITADLKVWAKEKYNVKNFQISLEIDRVYASWYAPGPKKQYAGIMIWQGGQECCDLYIRGVAARRKDTPVSVAEFQLELLKLILQEKSRSEIADFTRTVKQKLLAGGFDDKLLIHKGLSRDVDSYLVDSPHLRAAKKLIAQGEDVKRGDKVAYIRIGDKKDDVIAVRGKKIPKISQHGYEYIWKTQFEPVLDNLGMPAVTVKRLEEFR